MDKYKYSHCLKVYNKGFRHPWKTDGALCFGHMPCPDISSIIFVPKPGWYPIWSNYTVGRACGLLNQHGSGYSAAEKMLGWKPLCFHMECIPYLVSPLESRDAVKRLFQKFP